MSEQTDIRLRDEQAKARHLFARWRKDELLYKEDAKDLAKVQNETQHDQNQE